MVVSLQPLDVQGLPRVEVEDEQKAKVARSGNSLVVRIPAPLARYLKLRSGQEVLVEPDQKHRLVLDPA